MYPPKDPNFQKKIPLVTTRCIACNDIITHMQLLNKLVIVTCNDIIAMIPLCVRGLISQTKFCTNVFNFRLQFLFVQDFDDS